MSSPPIDHAPALPASIATLLDQVRARCFKSRAWLLPLALVLLLGIGWTLRAVMDRHWNLPWALRALLLLADVVVIGWLSYRWVIQPWWGYLDRKQAALWVERRVPGLKTSLISAVELTEEGAGSVPEAWPLVNQLLADVSRELEREDWVSKWFDGRRLKQLMWTAGVVALAALVLLVVYRPVSGLLLQRVLLSQRPLPDDTRVVSITKDLQVMAGENVWLSARAEGVVPESGKLRIIYDGGAVELLEVQPGKEPEQEAVLAREVRNVRGSFTYRFELNDGVGAEHRVKVVIPPALKEIQFVQRYPAYTGLTEARMPSTGLKLLQGSTLRVEAKASMALSAARLEITGEEAGRTESFELDVKKGEGGAVVLSAELKVPQQGWKTFSVKLTSEDGVNSVNDAVYRVQLIADQAPQVAVTEPEEERLTLLAYDRLPVAFRVTDDFGLAEVGVRYRVFRPGLSDFNENTESGVEQVSVKPGEKTLLHQWEWELSRLSPPLTPGCRISFWVEAKDNNTATGPSVARSVERSIEIVTEQQKRLELLELLGSRAKAVERLYRMQYETNEKTDRSIR